MSDGGHREAVLHDREHEVGRRGHRMRSARTTKAFQTVKELVAGYLAVSILTLATVIDRRNDPHEVSSAVWTRGIIVTLSALLTLLFTLRAAGGSRRAYLRLRIVTAAMPAAIVVIIAVPGTFPLWMKIEQGVCGLLLIVVAFIVNRSQIRSAFRQERKAPVDIP